MKIYVTLTAAELAESGLSSTQLQTLIVERLDTGTPSLPGFSVTIETTPQAVKLPQVQDLDIDLPRHRLLKDFDFQGISTRYVTQNTGSVCLWISAIPKLEAISKHELWIDVHRYALIAAAIALKLSNGNAELQIDDIVRVLTDLNQLRNIVDTLSATVSVEHANAVDWLHAFLHFWYDEDCKVWKTTLYRTLLQYLATELTLLNDCTEVVSAVANG
ncbi:hypothetical protein [Pseudomonas sp. NPDC089569]|uniref:hypothetical protein n=1 Tax=Pseudomonas sp. NPDC089569 TaxID=3390722 RepID=UPI003D077E86